MKCRVENLSVSYGQGNIVNSVSFSINSSEIVGLIGVNGAGKSTLLRGISKLEKYVTGKVYIDDLDIFKMSSKKKSQYISYMPQRYEVSGDMSVLQVVLLGVTPHMSYMSTPGKEHRDMAISLLKNLSVEQYVNRPFGTLSEGQKQLVLFARNLIQDSELLLLDEIDASLDFNNTHFVMKTVRDVIKNSTKSALMTMHDPNIALEYCDRILIMSEGRVKYNLNLKDIDVEDIQTSFASIYNNIVVRKQKGKYFVLYSQLKENYADEEKGMKLIEDWLEDEGHLFITGPRNIGKSTLIKKFEKKHGRVSGLNSRLIKDDEVPVGIMMYDKLNRDDWKWIASSNGKGMKLKRENFLEFTNRKLEELKNAPGDFVVIDEIGYVEKNEEEYISNLIELSKEKRILAVLRLGNNALSDSLDKFGKYKLVNLVDL